MMFSRSSKRSGFTLVELAIVLAVAGVLLAGLWRLLSTGNQQSMNQSAASQQLQLINSLKSYFSSSAGQTVITALGANTSSGLLAFPTVAACAATTPPAICAYLPPNFGSGTTNAYGQTYNYYSVLKDANAAGTAANSYSFMIVTEGTPAIPDSAGGPISADIGGDGGFIYSSSPCGSVACGSYGTWGADPATYGYTDGSTGAAGKLAAAGHIATRTYVSSTQDASLPWLERNTQIQPDATFSFNTMATDLYVGPKSGGAASNIYMAPYDTATATAATTGGGSIDMAGGGINLQGGGITSVVGAANKGSDAIILTGNSATGDSVLFANMPCTISQYIQTPAPGFWADAGGAACNFAITTSSIIVAGVISANGFYAGTFVYNGSDIRFKKNIKPLSDPLDKVMQLNPVSFDFRSNGKASMGVIAQDLEKVYPQLVSSGGDGKKYVAYDGLIAPLIGAVQELKKENDNLRGELKKQERREENLEEQLRSKQP